MKTKILRILRNSDGYTSGQALCDMLGVSRTAVWKVINQLKEDGYVIDSVSNRGYKLVSCPDVLTESEIESVMGEGIVSHVAFFKEIDSTNNEAKRQAEKGAGDGTLYITECQTNGRGRRGREWISPPGSSVYMTLLLRPEAAPDRASMLTIVAAMAMQKAVSEAVARAVSEGGKDVACAIKWPNDIVLDGKKMCGILTEMSAEPEYINYVVIGIGINVNTGEFAEEISKTATSIALATGVRVGRSEIVAAFSKHFKCYYEKFMRTYDLAEVVNDYNEMLVNRGRGVRAVYADREITGVAKGINELGELIIDTGSSTEIVRSGEVSVRGLYGYV